MRIKSLVTLIMTVCLAVLTSNAMAKSDKSEKSAKSEKSEMSVKSGKRGNGYGHCKSNKSGKGHSKKRGKGHERDDDCGAPVLVCVADDIIPDITYALDPESMEPIDVTGSITYAGKICAIGDEVIFQADVETDFDSGNSLPATLCEYSSIDSSVSIRQENATNFWYDMNIVLGCDTHPNS